MCQIKYLLFLFITVFSFIGCSKISLYYIRDAKMINNEGVEKIMILKERNDAVKKLLNGHYIASGNNLVILIRKFDRGSLFAIDDEVYEKLTIEIKNYTIGKQINLNSSNIIFYFSQGSCGFIYRGHGVYSSSGTGIISIKDIEKNKLLLKLDIEIFAQPAGSFPFEGRTIQIREEYILKEIKMDKLTPWLGVPDSSFGKEVYP